MAKAQKYTVALLPSNPAVALSYIADRLGKSEFVKSTSIWGGCILVESTSPVEFAERCKRITGLDIIAVGSIVKGFNNAAIQLKQTAVKAVQHGESYRVSVIRHSFNTFQEDEEESMHLTGIIIDEMKKKGSVVAGMEIAKAGFIPLPLLVLNFVDEDEFRRAIISSCFLTELVLDRDMELKLVTLESDESIKSTYEESLKAGESEAKRIGTDYICTGIHVSAELPKLLEVCKRSSCKVINPVLTWDRQRLMSSVPEELRRRYIYERRGKVSRVVGKEKVISVALTDLAHYNEALDTAIKNLKE